jgi:hypothetical protein
MKAGRGLCGLLLAVGCVLLGASSAGAGGKSVITGPVYIGSNDLYSCAATNGSKRTVTNVSFVIRRWNGAVFNTGSCPSVDPGNACPVGPFTNAQALTWTACEVVSDQGAKGLQVVLQNIDTGATSDAR